MSQYASVGTIRNWPALADLYHDAGWVAILSPIAHRIIAAAEHRYDKGITTIIPDYPRAYRTAARRVLHALLGLVPRLRLASHDPDALEWAIDLEDLVIGMPDPHRTKLATYSIDDQHYSRYPGNEVVVTDKGDPDYRLVSRPTKWAPTTDHTRAIIVEQEGDTRVYLDLEWATEPIMIGDLATKATEIKFGEMGLEEQRRYKCEASAHRRAMDALIDKLSEDY